MADDVQPMDAPAAAAPGNDKIAKGSDQDISGGPVKKRKCTDVLCCILFLAHFPALIYVAATFVPSGNPMRLLAGQDYEGNFCGIAGQISSAGVNLTEFPYVYYAMNATSSLDKIAAQLLPASSSGTNYTQVVAQAQAVTAAANGDPSALLAMTGGSSSGMLQELTKYFSPVCVKRCPGLVIPTSRKYLFEGPSDPKYQASWATMSQVESLRNSFVVSAMSLADCPYGAKHCVPLPGTQTMSVASRYCVPTLFDASQLGAASGAANAAASTVTAAIPAEALALVDVDFGSMVGDIAIAWDAMLVSGFTALVTGLVFLVVLRFVIGFAVWGAVFLVFFLFAGLGVAAVVKATQCAGQAFDFTSVEGVLNTTAAAAAKVSVTTNVSAALAAGGNVSNVVGAGANLTIAACANGYEIPDQTQRDIVRIVGYVFLGIAFVYFLFICCVRSRIKLAIAINKVAAQFVYQTRTPVMIPLIQIAISFAWWAFWILLASYIVSVVPAGLIPTDSWESRANTTTSTGSGPALVNYVKTTPSAAGYKAAKAACWRSSVWLGDDFLWRCTIPRFNLGPEFWFALFSLLWVNAFVIACGQCILAGAVGTWYFAPRSKKARISVVWPATKFVLTYHTGSLAFGAFILAVVQTIKYMLLYLAKQAQAQNNKIMAMIATALAYLVACVERFIKFLNKNAYIQIALCGKNFCVSAKNAFLLILRNAVRIAVLGLVGPLLRRLGEILITMTTVVVGYFVLTALHPNDISSPIFPVLLFVVIGFCCGRLTMNVYGLAVDASLQCFVADEELRAGGDKGDHTPLLLEQFLEQPHGLAKCCRCNLL